MLPDNINTGNLESEPNPAVCMSDREFSLFSSLIYSRLGIKMPVTKKLMLVSRLSRRLKNLGLGSYGEYYDLLCTGKGLSDEFSRCGYHKQD